MQVIFSNSEKSIIKNIESKDLWSKLSTLFVFNPEILDGLGERRVYNKSGNLKIYAEIFLLKWIDDSGKERESYFHGYDGYFLQSIVEDLES